MKETNTYYVYNTYNSQQEIFTEIWPNTIQKDINFFLNTVCQEDKKAK